MQQRNPTMCRTNPSIGNLFFVSFFPGVMPEKPAFRAPPETH
jgi:hypothetical protein